MSEHVLDAQKQQELHAYIASQRAAGVADEQTHKTLLAAGWSERILQREFAGRSTPDGSGLTPWASRLSLLLSILATVTGGFSVLVFAGLWVSAIFMLVLIPEVYSGLRLLLPIAGYAAWCAVLATGINSGLLFIYLRSKMFKLIFGGIREAMGSLSKSAFSGSLLRDGSWPSGAVLYVISLFVSIFCLYFLMGNFSGAFSQ